MRIIIILAITLSIFSGCKNTNMPPANAEIVSSDVPVPSWNDETISLYDSIKVPNIDIDTFLIYNELSELLKFTNELKRDGTNSFYEVAYKVDKESKVIFLWRNSTPVLNKQMSKVEEVLIKSISVVESASLVSDAKTKVDYRLTISFLVEDERVLFRLLGVGHKTFLYKNFKRPL